MSAAMKLLLLLTLSGFSTACAQYVKAAEKNLTVTRVPFDITNYDGTNSCGSIVSDRIGGECTTWEALAARGSDTNNNFGGWLIAGTKINGSRDSVSINGAPAGFVPDMYYTYTGEIGGVLSNRRVKTTINIDRMNCLNPECTWISDQRYVVDKCEGSIDKGLTVETDKGLTCQSPQWVFNKIRGTKLAIGRQLALDLNITNNYAQTSTLKIVDVSRNVRVQSLVGESSMLIEAHHIRYYKDDNRTSFKSLADFKPEDPTASIKDSTMHAILRKLYGGRPSLVIRAIKVKGICELFLVSGNNCNIQQSPTPVNDDCEYDQSAPVGSLLISRYYITKIIEEELYDLYLKQLLTEKTINATMIDILSGSETGYNTSLVYRLGVLPFLHINNGTVPQIESATELIDLAVEYPFACFEGGNISSIACTDFNKLSPSLTDPFEIIEAQGDMWLKVNMSSQFNFFPGYSVPNVNWDGIFDYLNRQVGCIDLITNSFDGLKEVDRWHNAMETLVYQNEPNDIRGGTFREAQPGIQGDSCSNSRTVNLRQDTQYLADLVVQVTNNALQTVSPTLTTISATVSFILVVLSFVALMLTLESGKAHNIAVLVTAVALLASVGILVGDNVNTKKQNDLFLNSVIIVEKVTNGNCGTGSPLYMSAITQSYVGGETPNIILWVAAGLLSVGIIATIIHLIIKHNRKKPVP